MLQQATWRRTRDLNLAATFGTCGVQVIPITTLDEPTGERITEFHLRGDGHLPAAVIPPEDPHQLRARFDLGSGGAPLPAHISVAIVRAAINAKTLERDDPAHPALDALLTLHARECLRTYMERGTRYRIQVHDRAPRAKYVEGEDPLRHSCRIPGTPLWTTQDLALAAAVSRIGCPVVDIQGTKGDRRFVLPRHGHKLPGRLFVEDAQEIARHLLSGDLVKQCPEHPVVWGYAACKFRMSILQHLKQGTMGSQVLMRFAKSTAWQRHRRSALVEERAPDRALDEALKHLRS